jgi:hypothetical protein
MKRVLVALAVLCLTVTVAGCGSKKSSSSTTSSAGSSQSSSSSSSSSSSASSSGSTSFSSVKNCQELEQLGAKFSQAIASSSASGNYDNVAKAYSELADAAPSDIRGDLKTLAGAFSTYLDALKKAGYKPGTTPTAAQIAALQKASQSFTDPKLKAAVAHLEAWGASHCSSASSNP